MTGADETPDRPINKKRDKPTQRPDIHNPAFNPARELGKHLANGAAFSAGKRLIDSAISNIEHNPDDNFLTSLIEWIRSL